MKPMLPWGVVLLLVFSFGGALRAAEKGEEKSEKEKRREAEAAAEEQLDGEDSRREPLLRGKVVLFSAENPDDPAVIGLFIVENQQYKLEASSEELKTELRTYSNKTVAMRGKIRDGGATFIANGVEGGGPPPGLIRNPDGL